MEKTENTTTDYSEESSKPTTWLRKLADESWQAELVISGIAIFGALSLPDLIKQLGNWLFTTFSEDKFFLLGMIMMYMLLMSGGLILAFLTHFFIRVLWIGMLGLSSVYPQGIQPIKNYSDDFNDKLLKEFPDLDMYSHKLDQLGSLIFSITSAVCMVLIASVFTIMIIMVLVSGIQYIFPGIGFLPAFGVIILLLLLPGILGGILHHKSFRDKDWVKKYHFSAFRFSNVALYTIFYRPFSYIIYTLISNAKEQNNVPFTIGLVVVSIFLGGFTAANSNIGYFLNTESFRRHAHLEYGIKTNFYEDQRLEDELILYGSLESEMLSGKFIKVFVPVMGREDEAREKLCGIYDKDLAQADAEKDTSLNYRILIQEKENECLRKYLSVYLNDQRISDYSMTKYTHPKTKQFGVRLYISCADCAIGRNEIKVSRPFPVDAEKPFDVFLPFIYEGEEK